MKRNKGEYGKLIYKYRGKWVALSADERNIIASGTTLAKAMKNANKTKEKKPIYVMVSDNIGNISYS